MGIHRYFLDFHDDQRPPPIDYNSVDKEGRTPFSFACVNGHDDDIEMLDDARIDVEVPNRDEQGPLYFAAYNGHVEVVKVLLASTREIDVENEGSC